MYLFLALLHIIQWLNYTFQVLHFLILIMVSLCSTNVVLGILIMRLVGVNEIKNATSLHTSIDVSKRNKLQKRGYGVLCCGLMPTKIFINNRISVELWKHDLKTHLGVSNWWSNGLRVIETNKFKDATSLHISIDDSKKTTTSKGCMECLVVD